MAGRLSPQFDYVARGTAPGKAEKLVFLLHGYGADASFMEKLAGEIEKLMPQARIIMPQAPEECDVPDTDDGNLLRVPQIVRETSGSGGDNGRQWFPIDGGIEDIKTRVVRTAQNLNAFIDKQRDDLGLQDSDIAIMGFSQGGSVALYAAFMRAAVGCAAGHSTLFPEPVNAPSKPPVLYLYGTDDEEFSPAVYAKNLENLRRSTNDVTVKVVAGLGHRTSAASRKITARYIADKLKP